MAPEYLNIEATAIFRLQIETEMMTEYVFAFANMFPTFPSVVFDFTCVWFGIDTIVLVVSKADQSIID